MSAKMILFFVLVWVLLMFVGSTIENYNTTATWAGTGTGGLPTAESPRNTLQYLSNISNAVQHLPVLGGIAIPFPNPDYFVAFYRVVTLQTFITSENMMFYWIFLLPFATMGVLAVVSLFFGVVRGNITWG